MGNMIEPKIGDVRYLLETGYCWNDVSVVKGKVRRISHVTFLGGKRTEIEMFVEGFSHRNQVIDLDDFYKRTYSTENDAMLVRKAFLQIEAEHELRKIQDFIEREGLHGRAQDVRQDHH